MRPLYLTALLVAVLASGAQAQKAPVTVDADAIASAFVRSQVLKQGDVESLKKAQAEFTPGGLTEFTKKMDGFLDDKGAPTFSQEFIPSTAIFMEQKSDVVIIHISGELKQTHNNSTTTYPGTFEVYAAGTPPKIVRFSLFIGTRK